MRGTRQSRRISARRCCASAGARKPSSSSGRPSLSTRGAGLRTRRSLLSCPTTNGAGTSRTTRCRCSVGALPAPGERWRARACSSPAPISCARSGGRRKLARSFSRCASWTSRARSSAASPNCSTGSRRTSGRTRRAQHRREALLDPPRLARAALASRACPRRARPRRRSGARARHPGAARAVERSGLAKARRAPRRAWRFARGGTGRRGAAAGSRARAVLDRALARTRTCGAPPRPTRRRASRFVEAVQRHGG